MEPIVRIGDVDVVLARATRMDEHALTGSPALCHSAAVPTF
jgi:hypothetical protein